MITNQVNEGFNAGLKEGRRQRISEFNFKIDKLIDLLKKSDEVKCRFVIAELEAIKMSFRINE